MTIVAAKEAYMGRLFVYALYIICIIITRISTALIGLLISLFHYIVVTNPVHMQHNEMETCLW